MTKEAACQKRCRKEHQRKRDKVSSIGFSDVLLQPRRLLSHGWCCLDEVATSTPLWKCRKWFRCMTSPRKHSQPSPFDRNINFNPSLFASSHLQDTVQSTFRNSCSFNLYHVLTRPGAGPQAWPPFPSVSSKRRSD